MQETNHVYLADILDAAELEAMLKAKRIKRTDHPTLPIYVLNYSDLATYAGEWTKAERVCRGLIVESETGKIIARGPSKFFNYGEPSAKTYPLDTMVRVTQKEDGSLGIHWAYEGHTGWATRGSFTSEQAVHATESHNMPEGYVNETAIGEIVYPANRIVLDYSGRDEVIPLGVVNDRTGLIEGRLNGEDRIMTLGRALALPIPDDEEGYVLDVIDGTNTIDHLKLKGARYKELHAAIFGLTERKVWEQIVAKTVGAFITALPDEVQPWAIAVRDRLYAEFSEIAMEVDAAYHVAYILPTRKEQAALVMSEYKHLSGALFAELDNHGSKAVGWIYNQIKPGHVPFQSVKETD